MKKVIGILMLVVMVFAIGFASADEIAHGIYASEAYYKVREFADINGLDDWYIENDVNGVIYGCGSISVKDFERETGMDWSMKNLEQYLTEQFELCEIRVCKAGEIENIDVYLMEAQSETKAVGSKYNEETKQYDEYYCGSVLFMVCDY